MSTKTIAVSFIVFVYIIYIIAIMIAITGFNGFDSSVNGNELTTNKTDETSKTTATEPLLPQKEYYSAWTIADVHIRREPKENGEIIVTYPWNTKVTITYIDNDWAQIGDTEYYINRDFVSESPAHYIDCAVPNNNTIKSYMDYRRITLKSSKQYRLQESLAYTDENGLRMVNGRYCIAVGSYYTTTIGQYIDVELENGRVIQAILADCKADKHTDSTNRINPNGSVVEFVVDADSLESMSKRMGDISYINEWNSKVVNVRVYDKVEEF